MMRGGPEAVGAVGEVRQAERLVVDDERPQDAPSGRTGADGVLLIAVEPDREELV